jgi:hypothetical protein
MVDQILLLASCSNINLDSFEKSSFVDQQGNVVNAMVIQEMLLLNSNTDQSSSCVQEARWAHEEGRLNGASLAIHWTSQARLWKIVKGEPRAEKVSHS